jgi:hypothetical protein
MIRPMAFSDVSSWPWCIGVEGKFLSEQDGCSDLYPDHAFGPLENMIIRHDAKIEIIRV